MFQALRCCIVNHTTKIDNAILGDCGIFIANIKMLSGFTRCMNPKMCVYIGLRVTTLCINKRMLCVRNVSINGVIFCMDEDGI